MLAFLSAAAALHAPMAQPQGRTARAGTVRDALAPGAEVIVAGGGPVMLLTAKLCALRGFNVYCAATPQDIAAASSYLFTSEHPEGTLPITMLPIAGPDATAEAIDGAAARAKAIIFAIDNEASITDRVLGVFAPLGSSNLEHICIMSRSLNGNGMGFFANAAKIAANSEIWAANSGAVQAYRATDEMVIRRAKEVGAKYTIVRAGTLKGGAVGDSLAGGSGCPSFLNTKFYDLGQQDIVNWRLLYDCAMMGVSLQKGDVLPGPGFTAALTATTPEGGSGDSHRGAVAAALVEALCVDAAANADFSVGSTKEPMPPSEVQWQALFSAA